MHKSLLLVPLIAALGACATAPVPLKGEFAALSPSESIVGGRSGERVRWGGEIIEVVPGESSTCIEMLTRTLDASARPQRSDSSDGRFIACRSGFYDPEVFLKGRELTIVGTIDGTRKGRVGQYDYVYPLLAADVIYLWPKRPLIIQQNFYDPFWGPGFGPYWGGGYWGPRPMPW